MKENCLQWQLVLLETNMQLIVGLKQVILLVQFTTTWVQNHHDFTT